MRILRWTAVLLICVTGSACRKDRKEHSVTSITAAQNPLPTVTVQPHSIQSSMNMELVATYEGLSTPACATYHAPSDRYLVANVAGKLSARSGKGFISAFSPSGTVAQARWIVGGTNGVTLNAPKGLVVKEDLLYVADVDTVRAFDVKTGAPRGELEIPGAVYLAGMTASADGRVLVADAGIHIKDDGRFDVVNDGAIWTVDAIDRPPGKVAVKGTLGGPSALDARPDGSLLVATLVDGTIYRVDPAGKKYDELTAERGKLDGVVQVENKIYVSSWGAAAVYRRIEGGTLAVQLSELQTPGGLGLDTMRNRLIVPLLGADRVEVFTVH
jgi:outer membrane protein assembly factor BamB